VPGLSIGDRFFPSGLDELPELLDLVHFLPGELVHEEGPRELAVDVSVQQVELLDHAGRGEIENLRDDLFEFAIREFSRPERVHVDREGPRHADGVGELDGALLGQSRGDDVFCCVTRAEGGGAVDFLGGFVHHGSAPELGAREASVELDNELASRDAGIGGAAGMDGLPLSRGIEEKLRLLVDPVPQDVKAHLLRNRLDVFLFALAHMPVVDGVGHENLDHPQRFSRLFVVFHADLALAVGREVGMLRLLEDPHHAIAQNIGQRQQLGGVRAGIPVHDPLVPGPDLLVLAEVGAGADVDVRRLGNDGVEHAHGTAVETETEVVVADPEDRVPDDLFHVHVGSGRHFSPDHAESLTEEDLDPAMRHVVYGQAEFFLLVEDGGDDIGGNGVGNDVRVSDLDAFRCDLHFPSMVTGFRSAFMPALFPSENKNVSI